MCWWVIFKIELSFFHNFCAEIVFLPCNVFDYLQLWIRFGNKTKPRSMVAGILLFAHDKTHDKIPSILPTYFRDSSLVLGQPWDCRGIVAVSMQNFTKPDDHWYIYIYIYIYIYRYRYRYRYLWMIETNSQGIVKTTKPNITAQSLAHKFVGL